MKDVALKWARDLSPYLGKEKGEKLCRLVEAVPDCDTMLHGDYHTKNVMLQKGETLLIDMDTLSCGHPIFELASMFLAYVGFSEQDHTVTQSFLGLPYEITNAIWRKSLVLYLNTTDDARIKEVADKAMVIGYTRLMRRTIRRNGFNTPEGQQTIAHAKARLEELLTRIDDLTF